MATKKPKAKPAVIVHAACVLVRRKDGTVDVCDPQSRVWSNFSTERHAKWSATVFTNLAQRFGRVVADEVECKQLALWTAAKPGTGRR